MKIWSRPKRKNEFWQKKMVCEDTDHNNVLLVKLI